MTDSIDLTKVNILTDTMYDTKGTGYVNATKPMVFTTPFSDQPQYNQRAGSKPFNVSKYPSTGNEWYRRSAANNVDLQTAMNEVLPDQQVQNWSRTKSLILQKQPKQEGFTKETAQESNLQKEIERLQKKHAKSKQKTKEGYITSPYDGAEDLWSASGRIKDFEDKIENFTITLNGKQMELIDVIIVILVIAILVIAIYCYIKNRNSKKQETKQEEVNVVQSTENTMSDQPQILPELSETQPIQAVQQNENENEGEKLGGGINVVNCGSLSGGSNFDTKIRI